MYRFHQDHRRSAAPAGSARRAAQLYLCHWTQQQIACHLGCSQATVSADLQTLREQWCQEHQALIAEALERELLELDEMEREAAEQCEATRSVKWFDLRLAIKDRRARMLGFYIHGREYLAGLNREPEMDLEEARREFAQAMHAVADEGEAKRRIEACLAELDALLAGSEGTR